MFDIGFWELLLIGLVALVVIGPERLPKVARVVGLWVGKARRTLGTVKSEIDRELKAQELQEILDKQARSNPLETIIEAPEPKRAKASAAPAPEERPAATDRDPAAAASAGQPTPRSPE